MRIVIKYVMMFNWIILYVCDVRTLYTYRIYVYIDYINSCDIIEY